MLNSIVRGIAIVSFFFFMSGTVCAQKKKKKKSSVNYEELIQDYIDIAEDVFSDGYLDSALVFANKADSVLSIYWNEFEKDGYMQEDRLLDNYLISQTYYTRANIYHKKYLWALDSVNGAIFDSTSYRYTLNNYAKVVNFESRNFYVVEHKSKGDLYFYLMEDLANTAVEGSKKYQKSPSVSVPHAFYELSLPFLEEESSKKERKAMQLLKEEDYKGAVAFFDKSDEIRSLTPSVAPSNEVIYSAALASYYQTFDSSRMDSLRQKSADKSMYYFQQLLDADYFGAGLIFEAVRKDDKKRVHFSSDEELDLMMNTGLYERDTVYPSKSLEKSIFSKVINLHIFSMDVEGGLSIVDSIRVNNPYDLDYLLQQATLIGMSPEDSLRLEFLEGIEKEIEREIFADMKSIVFYNSGKAMEVLDIDDKAIEYYRKSMVINPDYIKPVVSLGEIYYKKALVYQKEADRYGFSRKDRVRARKKHREKNLLYDRALTYLIKADVYFESTNIEVLDLLKSVYLAIDYIYEYKQVKEKLDALRSKKEIEKEFSADLFSI